MMLVFFGFIGSVHLVLNLSRLSRWHGWGGSDRFIDVDVENHWTEALAPRLHWKKKPFISHLPSCCICFPKLSKTSSVSSPIPLLSSFRNRPMCHTESKVLKIGVYSIYVHALYCVLMIMCGGKIGFCWGHCAGWGRWGFSYSGCCWAVLPSCCLHKSLSSWMDLTCPCSFAWVLWGFGSRFNGSSWHLAQYKTVFLLQPLFLIG